jgi:hypothetical protein
VETGFCKCGSTIFFANTQCVACQSPLGRCEGCHCITSFTTGGNEVPVWTCDVCHYEAKPCSHHFVGVCNSYIARDSAEEYCDWCAFTEVIPSLDIPENLAGWSALERAKRQLLAQLRLLRLPPQRFGEFETKPLKFRFMADGIDENGKAVRVYTGHLEGVITINIQEADSVYREKVRLELNEPQRTLIGHLRHEYGHYLDWCLPKSRRDEYVSIFGDPEQSYAEAKERYYAGDRDLDWKATHVSEYATMHPWEDFAETTNLYLDLLALIETSCETTTLGLTPTITIDDPMEAIVKRALEIAVAVSEFNADLGLPALLPENIATPVQMKLTMIHSLRLPSEAVSQRLRSCTTKVKRRGEPLAVG